MARTSPAPRKSNASPVSRVPVVVTMDAEGTVKDLVGDLDQFVSGEDTSEDVFNRLRNLLAGDMGTADSLLMVELSEGCFADVGIVRENEDLHFVLSSATQLAEGIRKYQQADNEAILLQRQIVRAIRQESKGVQSNGGYKDAKALVFGARSALLSDLVNEARSSVMQIAGHSRRLEKYCSNDPDALQSLAAIARAVARLDALSVNSLATLCDTGESPGEPRLLDVDELAQTIQQTFATWVRTLGVDLELHVVKAGSIAVDPVATRHILTNLVIHALDDPPCQRLELSLAVRPRCLEIEMECRPANFIAERFGTLTTTHDVLASDHGAAVGLAVVQQLVLQLEGTMELVPVLEGGHDLSVQLPVRSDPSR